MSARGVRPGVLHHKENNPADAQPGKRQRTAAGAGRQPLAAAPPPQEEPMVFSGREDVDALLNEKMKGKNKMDYKGKSEQMMEYIKKLRACTKWLLEREDANLVEIERITGQLDATHKQHSEIVAVLKNTIEETKSICEELQKQCASLQEALKTVEAEKMDALRSLGDEREARMGVESLRNGLLEDLNRAKLEEKRLNDQIKMLQDTNKRLQEYNTSLQQYNCNLQADATKNAETIVKLQKEKNTMVETMNGLKDHANSVKMQLDIARSLQNEATKQKTDLLKEVESIRMELQRAREDRDTKSAQVDSLLVDIGTYKEMTGKSVIELDSAMAKTSALEETCSSQRKMIETLEIKLAAANEKLKRSNMTASETMTEYENMKKMLESVQSRLEEAEQTILEGENLRKKLHNTILELKGNIRVFCRVRPLLPNESGAVSYPKNGENLGRGIELLHNAQGYSFTFDKVFDHSASQEHVFIEISQLVQSALDGYKVCIFAYGQTGSGKTYTMMGNPELEDQKGMIPRSLEQIFQASQTLNSQGWRYKMQASMLEIYNETIRDLLATNRMAVQDVGASKYSIKHDTNGNTNVSDLTIIDVTSINEVSSLLRRAAQSRSVGRTQMNEESSRSHCVFTLRIFGVNEGTDQQVQGVLNLIDLAGSERLNKSGATGDRLKETVAINKSLSCLSDVIFSIAKKEEHVPFRNSKLTYLLQPCLGGDSKTLMFVNLSPEASSTGESLCSLRFAARVNSCEIGIPRRQTQMRSSQ
ncbi:kinesin-related protein11 [Zea mays]|uniref:Kinesin-like protein n=3 Tax=Zea mays TaxID=4577 RepID=A0A1D6HQR4_MAIZE|nr:kinesin-related protein11 [Zea mays]ONM50901.1 kinesin-related protein11 [Zea mays]|eukprot:NP_001292799.1 kinesin-related protein11 [Zea mays]